MLTIGMLEVISIYKIRTLYFVFAQLQQIIIKHTIIDFKAIQASGVRCPGRLEQARRSA
jgi:hypothetical protein